MARVGQQRHGRRGNLVAHLCDTYFMKLLIKRWNNFMNAAVHNENGLVIPVHFVVL